MKFNQLFSKISLNIANKLTIYLVILANFTINYGMDKGGKPFGSGAKSSFSRVARASQAPNLSRTLVPTLALDPDLQLAPDLILALYNLHGTSELPAVKNLPKNYLNKQARTTFYCSRKRTNKNK